MTLRVAFVDTSALAAVLLSEPGGEAVRRELDRLDALIASALLEAELRSVFSRESLDPALVQPALDAIRWVLPDRPLSREIGAVLHIGHLRGADLWHVACALYVVRRPSDLPFVTLDVDQKRVAAKLGFPTPV